MTPAQIIYSRRMAVLKHAEQSGSVSATYWTFRISLTRYCEWKRRSDRYGLAVVMPKEHLRQRMPVAAPTRVVEALLTLAVRQPTLGCWRYAYLLGDRGFSIAKLTVQRHLVAHGLGCRAQRLTKATAITAASTGLVIEAAVDAGPIWLSLDIGGQGELMCLASFYIGKLEGVGKVWRHAAIDVFSRGAVVTIVLGPVTTTASARLVAHVLRFYWQQGMNVRAVLSDNHPEYAASGYQASLAAQGLRRERIPAGLPKYNVVVEHSHRTILQECWRPAIYQCRCNSARQPQQEANAWLRTSHHRRNYAECMVGRTAVDAVDTHRHHQISSPLPQSCPGTSLQGLHVLGIGARSQGESRTSVRNTVRESALVGDR